MLRLFEKQFFLRVKQIDLEVYRSRKSIWMEVGVLVLSLENEPGFGNVRVYLFQGHYARDIILLFLIGQILLQTFKELSDWLVTCGLEEGKMHLKSIFIFFNELDCFFNQHL